MSYPLTQQIAAVKQVASEKRGAGEVELADALQAALATLVARSTATGNVHLASEQEPLPPTAQAPLTLYKQFEAEYHAFCERETGGKGKMDGGQGKALNDIINYLLANCRKRTATGALESWKFLLDHWHQLPSDFLSRQKTLTGINKYLLEMLEAVRKANRALPKAGPSPQMKALRRKLESELDDAQKSVAYFAGLADSPATANHRNQAAQRVQELEQRLRQLA